MAKRRTKKTSPRRATPETTTPDTGPTKAMTIRLNLDAWRTLKLLALDDGRTAHALLVDAFNDYTSKRGKGRPA